ncbi:hypothetical protein KORDIASMS9_01549 [Kordia sp. SMS9]|nr:hypothetical protein KORDIASMS9_01549 [Kordia sp. SMS9]
MGLTTFAANPIVFLKRIFHGNFVLPIAKKSFYLFNNNSLRDHSIFGDKVKQIESFWKVERYIKR